MADHPLKDQIVLDLGDDYGEIAVAAIPTPRDEGLVEAGIVDDVIEPLKVKLEELLRGPLTGMGIALRRALPSAERLDGGDYEFDNFTAEFELGLAHDAGVDMGVVAKIIPSGSFHCTYTWKRKS